MGSLGYKLMKTILSSEKLKHVFHISCDNVCKENGAKQGFFILSLRSLRFISILLRFNSNAESQISQTPQMY